LPEHTRLQAFQVHDDIRQLRHEDIIAAQDSYANGSASRADFTRPVHFSRPLTPLRPDPAFGEIPGNLSISLAGFVRMT
jgi:hypothetical protein